MLAGVCLLKYSCKLISLFCSLELASDELEKMYKRSCFLNTGSAAVFSFFFFKKKKPAFFMHTVPRLPHDQEYPQAQCDHVPLKESKVSPSIN